MPTCWRCTRRPRGAATRYRSKIRRCDCEPILVTRGQLDYEWQRLLAKQRLRDPAFYRANMQVRPRAHPLFRITSGPIASWERS
jgi:hypothetical protein